MTKSELGLLLVDVQRDFWEPLRDEPAFAAFPDNLRTLLAAARRHGLPVIHTQAVFRPDGGDWMLFYRAPPPHGRGRIPCVAGTPGAQLEDFAAPLPGEPVVTKQAFDGFAGTDLETVLRAHGVRAVLVAGLVTSVCVLFTATSAYLKRFVPLVVTDACGDTVDAHESTLRRYAGLSFQTVTTLQVAADLPAVLALAAAFVDEMR